MRFFATLAALAVAALVSAQETTASETSVESTTVEASSTSTSLSPQATCLAACDASDICCQAACVDVPCPNEAAANATTDCAGQCVQGNGTQEETEAYASCQASCISSFYLTATSGAPAATGTGASVTGASASGTGSFSFGSSSATSTGSSSDSASSGASDASASSTSSGSSASESGNAAPETQVAIAGAGLFGLLVAGLML